MNSRPADEEPAHPNTTTRAEERTARASQGRTARTRTAEADAHAPLNELRDDLHRELRLPGPPRDYTPTRESPPGQPLLPLTTRSRHQLASTPRNE